MRVLVRVVCAGRLRVTSEASFSRSVTTSLHKRFNMVQITDAAKKQLLVVTEQRELSPGKFLRLAVPPVWEGEGDFGIVIDDRGVTDLSVTEGNRTVLLIGPEVDQAVPNSVLDFKTPQEGPRFTLDVF